MPCRSTAQLFLLLLQILELCLRSRDNLDSKNTIINLPGQTWLKASLHNKLWVRLEYCSPEKEGMEMGQSVSFLSLEKRVQWGEEWEGKTAPPALPCTRLSCSSNSPISSTDRAGDGLQLFGHILPGVTDSHFDLPSAGLVPGNAWNNWLFFPSPRGQRLLPRREASYYFAKFQGNRKGKMGTRGLTSW